MLTRAGRIMGFHSEVLAIIDEMHATREERDSPKEEKKGTSVRKGKIKESGEQVKNSQSGIAANYDPRSYKTVENLKNLGALVEKQKEEIASSKKPEAPEQRDPFVSYIETVYNQMRRLKAVVEQYKSEITSNERHMWNTADYEPFIYEYICDMCFSTGERVRKRDISREMYGLPLPFTDTQNHLPLSSMKLLNDINSMVDPFGSFFSRKRLPPLQPSETKPINTWKPESKKKSEESVPASSSALSTHVYVKPKQLTEAEKEQLVKKSIAEDRTRLEEECKYYTKRAELFYSGM